MSAPVERKTQEVEQVSRKDLRPIFSPASIAVVGASRRPDSVGYAIFSNILHNGYTGVLYPVNPNAKSISGVRAYPSVLEVPDEVDLAVMILPARLMPRAVEECREKGVKGIVVISAGFKEIGDAGLALEAEVRRIARDAGIPLVGPNCLGVINTDPEISMNATFGTTMPRAGNIAFISQSGALCTAVLDYAKGEEIGFSKFVSMGNKADVDETDLLIALANDPKTDVILMYLEDLTSGRRFIDVAREITGEIERRKPILAIKSGRTAAGARAASSHTGSLAGSDEVYDGIFAQAGVLRVDSVQELFDYALGFSLQPIPQGRRLAVITNAGGPGIMATDASIRYGLEMATFEEQTVMELKKKLPPTASLQNPIDVIGDAQHERYEVALAAALRDQNVHGAIVILTPQAMTDIREIAQVVCRISRRFNKPVLASFMGIVDVSPGVKILEKEGIPHYIFPESAARALATMYHYGQWVTRPRSEVVHFTVDRDRAKAVLQGAIERGLDHLPEVEAVKVLGAYGLPVLKAGLATDEDEAVRIAGEIGYPVVMKIMSPDIVHKVDVGGVKLDIETEAELRESHRTMVENVRAKRPDATLWGVNIQEMAVGGKETILGMKRDPHFGPILMFGLGGIYVEAMRDVTFRVAPIREFGAERMIQSIRAHRILTGVRGEGPSDLDTLAECILRLSQLACDLEQIDELDINPLMVFARGKGCKVADARILIGSTA